MNAEPGDDLIVDSDVAGGAERVGTILEIGGSDSRPEYLVHWVIGDYDSLISPWPGVHVGHRHHDGAIASSHLAADGIRAATGSTAI